MPRFGIGRLGLTLAFVSLAAFTPIAFADTPTEFDSYVIDLAAPSAPLAVAPAPALFESGIASTYGSGDGFEGRRTACGRVFHTNVVQVAHKTLPCGTLVRVEDSQTGRTVDAEVTDRGPYVRGRIVDLSWAAFRELEPAGPGLLQVNVYLLDEN